MNGQLWSRDFCNTLANFSCYKDLYYENYVVNGTQECYDFYYYSTHKMCVHCCQTSDAIYYDIPLSINIIILAVCIYVFL